MVSKRKQKKSPQKSVHNEDIYLNDLQVEIKQEEELIIEDADQQHVQWRFIGFDDDVNEEGVDWEAAEFQQVYSQNQYEVGNQHYNQSQDASFDEVIEISDDENDNYEEETMEGDVSCEVLITNEPLQDSFIETNGPHNQSSSKIEDNNESTNACEDNGVVESETVKCGKTNNITNTEGAQQVKLDSNIGKAIVANHAKAADNVDLLNVGSINEWMCRKLIKMACHICGTTFRHNVYSWLSHMKQLHPKCLRGILSKYKPHSDSAVICKICKMHVTPKINHTLHYLTRHLDPKPQLFLCASCNYTDFSLMSLQKHQVEKHASLIGKREKCPKCYESFKDDTVLEFHFMSEHVREFNAKYVYKCHLCDRANFESSKNKLYGHLMDNHKLANFKILNFRKFENGPYMSCTKCYKIFVKTNVQHLLGHYLTHEDKCTWSCKFCRSTNHFKDWAIPHLCPAMRKFYEEKCKSTAIENGNSVSNEEDTNGGSFQEGQKPKSVSWNEFEAYIEHICPFCNEGFYKFEDWRLHVREMHQIHTLEGLNMTIIPEENDKLLCLQCNTHVIKSAIELHKHRFQHLPYEPYKCRHCSKCLPTYNKALCHVQKSCQDNDDDKLYKSNSIQTIISKPESLTLQDAAAAVSISCTLCNNKKFSSFSEISKHISNVHDNFDKYFTKATKERSRVCKICQIDMKRNKISELIGHYLQHLNERPFKCQKCSRSYPTYRIAVKHVQSYHFHNTTTGTKEYTQTSTIKLEQETKEESTSSPLPPPALPPSPTLTPSPILPPTSVQTSTTLKHATSHLQEDTPHDFRSCASKLTSGINVLDCTNSVFKTYEKYIQYACPECNEPFSNLMTWEAHVTLKHTFYKGNDLHIIDIGKGKTKCTDCNVILPTCLSKQQNHKLTHMPFRPFICALCLSRFTAISSAYKHFRKSHFGVGSFQCDLCPKSFSTDFKRLEHVKQVHPCKKMPSNVCTICFKIINDMDEHLRTNHLINERKHRCEYCGSCFGHSKELESHTEKIHLNSRKQAVNETSCATSIAIRRLGKRKLCSLSSDGNSNNTKKVCSSSIAPIKSGRK